MTMPPGVAVGLGGYLVTLAAERAAELVVSARHARSLRARGAVEHGRSHFWMFVTLHALFPILLVIEVVALGARPWAWWPALLAALLAAKALRFAAIRALGSYWNVRVWVVPGMTPVMSGPYRWLRHPNYVAVAAELAIAPLLFGAWRTAAAVSALNLVALAVRVRVEETAIATASAARPE